MRFLIPFFLLLALVGCTDKDRVPVMGNWTGGFFTERGQAFKGYLQLYLTGDKFKMRLSSKDQAMDLEGTWKVDAKRVILSVNNIDFQNPSEDDQKALGLKIISPDEVRTAYGHESKTKLSGLTITLGNLSGRHEFVKGEATKNTEKALEGLR